MSVTRPSNREKLPGRFEALVTLVPPQAITDDGQHEQMVEMIDRLMAIDTLTKGQACYLETLVQLVQVYEATHHRIDLYDISGIDSLKHLMVENEMSAADLGRLLGVHASMGSKILKSQRSLTVDHLKKLAAYFKVSPELFID